ncbi:MAG: single-stranded DNA-binding protein, partial [Spirochaetota bacterium]
EGNLTKNPEGVFTSGGSRVANMDLASNRYYRKQDEQVQEVMFIKMEAWGHTAEICENYLRKGSWVRAVGRLKQERWKSADGAYHSRHVMVAEHVEFRQKRRQEEKQSDTAEEGVPEQTDDEQVF